MFEKLLNIYPTKPRAVYLLEILHKKNFDPSQRFFGKIEITPWIFNHVHLRFQFDKAVVVVFAFQNHFNHIWERNNKILFDRFCYQIWQTISVEIVSNQVLIRHKVLSLTLTLFKIVFILFLTFLLSYHHHL